MRNRIKYAALPLALFILLINISVLAAASIPAHTERFFINDYANVIDSETEDYIYETGKKYNDGGGTQVVVLTMESIDGSSLEDFSIETARKWGIGDADKDNGVLILLVTDSRDIRIEVGYGLEGVLNDGKCGRFIRAASDKLSSGDYSGGIKQIYDSVIGELEEPTEDTDEDDETGNVIFYGVVILAFIIFVIISSHFGGRGGGSRRARTFGGYNTFGGTRSGFGGGSNFGGGGFSGGGGGFGGGGASGKF